MERRRTLVRLTGLVAGSLVLLAGATACSSGPLEPPPAATVDGVEIPQAAVEDLVAASKRFYTQAEELGLDEAGSYAAQLEAFDGAGADTVSRSEVSSALFSLVRAELIRAELAREDALPTDEDRDAARASLEQQLTKEVVDQIDEEFLEFSIESQVYVQAYQVLLAEQADAEQVPLDPEEVEAQRRELYENLAPTQPICLNLIQVATEAEAQAALDRLDGGESFGALAVELSLQETTEEDGGFFACGSAEQVQQSFGIDVSSAAVGDVLGPVEFPSQDGSAPTWALLEIDSVDGPTYEQLLPQLEQEIPSEVVPTDPTQLDPTTAIDQLATDAEIEIDPKFGSWDDATGTVSPPAVIATPTTTTSALPLVGS